MTVPSHGETPMSEEKKMVVNRKGLAHTFGWLRRPELDTETAMVWEDCEGHLHAVKEGQQPIVGEVIRNGKKIRRFFKG